MAKRCDNCKEWKQVTIFHEGICKLIKKQVNAWNRCEKFKDEQGIEGKE